MMNLPQYKLKDGFFITNNGNAKTIHINSEQLSPSWLEKQNASVEEYKSTHTNEGIDTRTKSLYRLFNTYINNFIHLTYGDLPINILDIGCGTFTGLPPYISEIKKEVTYVGLDPLDVNPTRDYLFICGAVEDLYLYLHEDVKFNIFLFSTSLDHIENIEECASSIRKLAKHPSYCIFFLGLHDVKIVAEQMGGGIFKQIYQNMEMGKVIIRLIKSILISMPLSFKSMYIRNKNLMEKRPLDDKHFHYFTLNNICDYMNIFGDVVDSVIIPGNNAMFITVKMNSR